MADPDPDVIVDPHNSGGLIICCGENCIRYRGASTSFIGSPDLGDSDEFELPVTLPGGTAGTRMFTRAATMSYGGWGQLVEDLHRVIPIAHAEKHRPGPSAIVVKVRNITRIDLADMGILRKLAENTGLKILLQTFD